MSTGKNLVCRRATIPPAMQHTQRAIWNGPPERLPDVWRLEKQKAGRMLTAVCALYTHLLGWDLRLSIDDRGLVMSSVVGSADEMVATSEKW
jgi:hypothetical protein